MDQLLNLTAFFAAMFDAVIVAMWLALLCVGSETQRLTLQMNSVESVAGKAFIAAFIYTAVYNYGFHAQMGWKVVGSMAGLLSLVFVWAVATLKHDEQSLFGPRADASDELVKAARQSIRRPAKG